jgi:hypothetical protein
MSRDERKDGLFVYVGDPTTIVSSPPEAPQQNSQRGQKIDEHVL